MTDNAICEICEMNLARYILKDTITEEVNSFCEKCLPEEYKNNYKKRGRR